MLDKKTSLRAGLWAMLLLGIFAVMAWASPVDQPGESKAKMEQAGPEGEARFGQRLIAELNLNDDQIAKLKADRLNARKQMIRDMAEIKTLHLDLFDEITNDKTDLDKVERLVKQIGELQTKMLMNRTKGMIFLRSILTPEQKRKFMEMHERMDADGPHAPWRGPGEEREHQDTRTHGDEK